MCVGALSHGTVPTRGFEEALRTGTLLDGYRGTPPADRSALLSFILRISALVESIPELHELDLNPVKVLPAGEGAIVVDGRMRIGLHQRGET